MLEVDVFTCYATAGAGSLVGLGLMSMIQTDQRRLQSALTLFRRAFLCLATLLLIFLVPDSWRQAVTVFAIGMAVAGVSLLAWAFRVLNGRHTPAQLGWGLTVAASVVLWCAGIWGGADTYVRAVAGVFALLGMATAIDQGWLLLRSPRAHGTEISLMLVASLFALMWVLTLGHTFAVDGPYPAHALFAPAWLLPITAQTFAILPLAVAALVFASINQRLSQQLRTHALCDELTGALSRRGFRELAARMTSAMKPGQGMVALMWVDVDHFKAFNDRHGQQAGDVMLKHLTRVMRGHLREDVLLARHNGEVFTVMMPVRSHLEASAVAERLRHQVAEAPLTLHGTEVALTVSIGVAFQAPHETLDEVLGKAETCMQHAKAAGRNRVVTAPMGV